MTVAKEIHVDAATVPSVITEMRTALKTFLDRKEVFALLF